MSDQLGALRFSAGQRPAGRSRRGSRARSRRTSRVSPPAISAVGHDCSSRPRTHSARSLICMAQTSAMLSRRSWRTVPPRSGGCPRSRAVWKVIARSHECPDVGLHRLPVLGRNDFWIFGIRPSYVTLTPSTLTLVVLVQQVVQLLLGELGDRLVGVDKSRSAEDPSVPAVHAVDRRSARPSSRDLPVSYSAVRSSPRPCPCPRSAVTCRR